LQLQNNSALGVEFTPEAYSSILRFEIKKKWLFNFEGWYIDKYINDYSRVKPENIMKLRRYMWIEHLPNQVRYLPYHAYPT